MSGAGTGAPPDPRRTGGQQTGTTAGGDQGRVRRPAQASVVSASSTITQNRQDLTSPIPAEP
jgi:hypothetical protein